MKKNILTIGLVFAFNFAISINSAFATVYDITIDEQGMPLLNEIADAQMNEVSVGKSKGWTYGTFFSMAGSEMTRIHKFNVEPGGHIGEHAGGSNYVCFVSEGFGTITLTHNGKDVFKVHFKQGDIVSLSKGTVRYWDIGPEKLVVLGVEQVVL